MLTVHTESALLLMSVRHEVNILMIYYWELVIHSNLVVICECQDIDVVEVVEGRSDVYAEIYECTWTKICAVHRLEMWFMKHEVEITA